MLKPQMIVGLFAVLLLVALPAIAEEDTATKTDPKAAYAARVAAMPAPSAKHAVEFTCDLIMGGESMGESTFKVEPYTEEHEGETMGEASGPTHWKITETLSFMGGSYQRTSVTYLDKRLEPRLGTVEGTVPQGPPFHIEWRWSPTGFLLKKTLGEGEAASTTEEKAAFEGPCMSTISALWLFCGANRKAKGTYETVIFEPDPGPGSTRFDKGVWTIGDVTTWKGQPALVVKGTKGENSTMEAAFDPETGAYLGSTFTAEMGEFEFRLRKESEAPAEEKEDGYTPAKTAKEAALQAALGFGSGNVELLEKVVHWPTIHAVMKAKYDEQNAANEAAPPFPTLDALKADVKASWVKSLPKNPPAMIEMGLKMAEGTLSMKEMDGFTRVQFPEIFRNLALDVAEIDGVWHLVRFPAAPK